MLEIFSNTNNKILNIGGKYMSKFISLSKENFQSEVIESKGLVFVDFHTKGCGPCGLIPPIMKKLKETYGDRLKVCEYDVKLDDLIAKSDDVVEKYKVYGFPNIIIFKNGEIKENILGMYEIQDFIDAIERSL